MKKVYLIISILVLFTVLAIVGFGCATERNQSQVPIELPRVMAAGELLGKSGIIISQQSVGLWVNGLGKSTAAPDVVLLSIGVESQEKTVAEAQRGAVDAMNRVMTVLKNSGIADKDIQTKQFNIQQVTRWDDKQSTQVVIGYRVTNTVLAKIRSIDKAGSVIDSAAAAGGDLIRVNSIDFTVDDPAPYYKIAREKALQYAMEKAKQMAQISGVKLGKLLYVNEGSVYTPPARDNYMKYAGADMAPAVPTPISPGELEFQVTVEMVYEIN